MAAQPGAELVLAYRQLSRVLARMVTEAKAAGRSTVFLEAQLREVSDALAAVRAGEAALVITEMPSDYRDSADAAQSTLTAARVPIVQEGFTGLDRAAVRTLQTRVSPTLGGVRQALTTGLALGDPREAVTAIRAAIAGDSNLVRVVGGQVKVVTPSGRFWDPTAYSRMLARTAIADTRRVAFRQRYLQNGVDVVKVVANGTVHEVCKVWEGQQLSLTGSTPGLPTVADARGAGLFHPNCRHRYVVDRSALREQETPLPTGAPRVPPPSDALPILGRAPRASRVPTVPRI